MRFPKVLIIGLSVAGVVGCGTTTSSQRSSFVEVTASASSPAASEEPSAAPEEPPASEKLAAEGPDADKPDSGNGPDNGTGGSEPATTNKPPHPAGPANSLMKTGQKGVALTFDDGPDPVQTPKLLDLLAKTNVKATFCLVGKNVAAHPDLVQRIAAEGHTLCNHTWNHSLTLGKQSPDLIRADLERTNDAIRAAAPGAEIKYMRAPGGNFTPAFVKVAASLGMTSIYWQVDPRDWDHPSGESTAAHESKVIRTVQKRVKPGAIVLSHDYQQPDTITAYETLIPWLKERYTLIPMP